MRKDQLYLLTLLVISLIVFVIGYFSFGSIDNIQETTETISFEGLKIDGVGAKIVVEKRDQINLNRIYSYGFDDEDLIKAILLSHRFTN